MAVTLALAQKIVSAALAHARGASFKPLSVVVLDARGAVIAAASEDGASLKRFEIAHDKAQGAIAFNLGSRRLGDIGVERPHFITGAVQAVGGLVPVAGGVLIKSADGETLGVVGVSGDTADNDELAAMAGIKAVGLAADGG